MSGIDPRGLRLGGGGQAGAGGADAGAGGAAGGREVAFSFEGRTLRGIEGEPIAAALHAQGVQVLGLSAKYRRPRGLHCAADACPNCQLRVNGLPGVSACVTPLRAGDEVARQKGAPNADRDALAIVDALSAFAPVGFQYRRFRRSPRLFHRWERLLARLAGAGAVPSAEAARRVADHGGWSTVETGVAVIGGGAAGMAAALAAARAGASVVLVERRARLAGGLPTGPGAGADAAPGAAAALGVADLPELAAAVRAEPGIDLRFGTTAAGWYTEGVLALTGPDGPCELRPGAVVLATGAHERPLAFADNDRPGVMLAAAVERLLVEHRLRAGRRLVVATNEPYGWHVARLAAEHGIEVAAVVEARGAVGDAERAAADVLDAGGTRILLGRRAQAALGRRTVRGVRLDDGTTIACDTIAVANGRRPARELLLQRAAAGGHAMQVPASVLAARADAAVPVADGWWLAGAAGGSETVPEAVEGGERAGAAAAVHADAEAAR